MNAILLLLWRTSQDSKFSKRERNTWQVSLVWSSVTKLESCWLQISINTILSFSGVTSKLTLPWPRQETEEEYSPNSFLSLVLERTCPSLSHPPRRLSTSCLPLEFKRTAKWFRISFSTCYRRVLKLSKTWWSTPLRSPPNLSLTPPPSPGLNLSPDSLPEPDFEVLSIANEVEQPVSPVKPQATEETSLPPPSKEISSKIDPQNVIEGRLRRHANAVTIASPPPKNYH